MREPSFWAVPDRLDHLVVVVDELREVGPHRTLRVGLRARARGGRVWFDFYEDFSGGELAVVGAFLAMLMDRVVHENDPAQLGTQMARAAHRLRQGAPETY